MKYSAAPLLLLLFSPMVNAAAGPDARDIIRDAINHYRGLTSYSEMTMTIHRPDWERTMSMNGWSSGGKKTLVRVTAPLPTSTSRNLTLISSETTLLNLLINRKNISLSGALVIMIRIKRSKN